MERNFTEAEIAYCRSQPSPQASFAGRWVGKEAVFKSLGVSSKGAAAAMKDIEILPNESGVPTVSLHGDAKFAADSKGIQQVLVSLSHSEVGWLYYFHDLPLTLFVECRNRFCSSIMMTFYVTVSIPIRPH